MSKISDVLQKQPDSLHSSRVISAEVMMVKFLVLHNLPFKAADHLSELLPVMFPDSAIAADFACKWTKTKAIVSDVLDPFMKKPVIEQLKVALYSLLCDESNDRSDTVKLLTVLVRLFDTTHQITVTRHLETVGITDLTAEGIFSPISQTLGKNQVHTLICWEARNCQGSGDWTHRRQKWWDHASRWLQGVCLQYFDQDWRHHECSSHKKFADSTC